MIAFACAITDEDVYAHCAQPGFRPRGRARHGDHRPTAADGSIFRSYNVLLEPGGGDRPELEALVLVHQDAEIVDPDFLPKVREALTDPDVAIVGCAGAVDVRSIAWWEGSVTWASFTHHFDEFGGGEIPALSLAPRARCPVYAEPRRGRLGRRLRHGVLAVGDPESPLRRVGRRNALHGYDFDICMQARAAGKKVVVADLKVVHHHSLELISDVEGWIKAHMTLTEKWARPATGRTRRLAPRARRAEAELSATEARADLGRADPGLQGKELEAELENVKNSISWKLTTPLRWVREDLSGGRSETENGALQRDAAQAASRSSPSAGRTSRARRSASRAA